MLRDCARRIATDATSNNENHEEQFKQTISDTKKVSLSLFLIIFHTFE